MSETANSIEARANTRAARALPDDKGQVGLEAVEGAIRRCRLYVDLDDRAVVKGAPALIPSDIREQICILLDHVAPTASPWIPVSERLPEHADKKWITIEAPWYTRPIVEKGRFIGTEWQVLTSDGYESLSENAKVTAWQDEENRPSPFIADKGGE